MSVLMAVMSAPASLTGDGRQTHFEVMVGKSIAEDRTDRYFGFVQSFDRKLRRHLHEVLRYPNQATCLFSPLYHVTTRFCGQRCILHSAKQ